MAGMGEAERRGSGPLLIGITGAIGCGKSTVARILGQLGGHVIDADVLARRATDAGQATLADIRRRFGDGVFTAAGELDRTALASLVFADPGALADLEAIVHPEVRRMVEQELSSPAAAGSPFVVIEAIKLVEGGLADRCDELWLVECAPETQRARLIARGASPGDAQQRIVAQGADLGDRLLALIEQRRASARPRVRRLSTNGGIDDVRERTEDALADALDADRT